MAGDTKRGLHPAVAGAVGAAVGAGLAMAVNRVVTDKKTRDKLIGMATNVRDKIADTMEPVLNERTSAPEVHESRVTKRKAKKTS